ncbi:MAG: four helix bundle protein [Tunicatimonas sp.]|uniref:four helix bundle protein n=1 Tax=Tunicatimonas sp. TaxID=1940096 RepID=UPI003C725C4E
MTSTDADNIIRKQLIRSATSVGANTRAAFRGSSRKKFIAKLGTVIKEADESLYWLELLMEGKMINQNSALDVVMKETEELIALFISIKQRYKT